MLMAEIPGKIETTDKRLKPPISLGGMCMNHALHSTNISLSFC